jgi:two-component system sensor histidine kinase/response regulator
MSEQQNDEAAERKLREEILSALNHDLRSPLGAIGIFCEILLLNAAALDDNQRQSLAMIQEANAKALRILDDAAELNTIYKGTVPLRQEAVDLSELLDRVTSTLGEALQAKGIHVVADGSSSIHPSIDIEKTQQLLLRLGEEAQSHSARGATIHFHLADTSAAAEVHVSIEGPTSEQKASSMRPDAGSAKGRLGTRKPAESRYSLAACKTLATLMGGDLELYTDPVFSATLRLPASSA